MLANSPRPQKPVFSPKPLLSMWGPCHSPICPWLSYLLSWKQKARGFGSGASTLLLGISRCSINPEFPLHLQGDGARNPSKEGAAPCASRGHEVPRRRRWLPREGGLRGDREAREGADFPF